MRILYAIQGTGNGHLSRARDIVPLLQRKGEVDLLVSGSQADIDLPYPVKYRFKGLSFIFGKKGGVDLLETYKKGKLRRLLSEIQRLPIDRYDLVLNDFEPVSAWACYIKSKPCISLSHQAAVLNKNAPKPQHADPLGKALLKYYAPVTKRYGFHFKAYDAHIYTPVIRQEVRQLRPGNLGYYTVYLPAYDDERIIKTLSLCSGVRWEVFSKHNSTAVVHKNISIRPVSNEGFISSMAGAEGVVCGAGFETPAEAMFLGKKLLVIPMKNQYEQHCNAAALESLGVPVIKSLKKKHCEKIAEWIKNGKPVPVDYPDITEEVLDKIITDPDSYQPRTAMPAKVEESFSVKNLRNQSLKKILAYLAS